MVGKGPQQEVTNSLEVTTREGDAKPGTMEDTMAWEGSGVKIMRVKEKNIPDQSIE